MGTWCRHWGYREQDCSLPGPGKVLAQWEELGKKQVYKYITRVILGDENCKDSETVGGRGSFPVC